MQSLADYDPYAIQEIQFFVQKKTKYTTLKSIIATLIILGLTVALNINAIQHLWLDRSELPIVSTSRKMSFENMTSSYLCIFPKTLTDPIPKTALININTRTNQTLKTYAITDKFASNDDILKVGKGRTSVCYDVQGAILTSQIFLQLTLYSTNLDKFDFIFKTYSVAELMQTQPSNYYYRQKNDAVASPAGYNLQVKKISAIYNDQLLIDYQPQQIFGCGTRISQKIVESANGFDSSINLYSQFNSPFDVTDQYVFTRYNIFQILGRLLSWFSIFVLICAFIVSPILDFNYRLQISKKLYDNEKLNAIDLSFLSYIRYLISKLKKKIFNQDILQTAFNKLQKDIDLLNIIKKQFLMKKLIKENQFLNHQPKQITNTAINQLNMVDLSEVMISKDLLLSQHQHQNFKPQNSSSLQNYKEYYPIVTDKDQQCQDNWIVQLIKGFDIAEVQISLISNKGQGYKTSWNTIISVLFLAAVCWFIVFAGLFQLSPNYTIQAISLLEDQTIFPQITLNPQDIIFRANKSITATFGLNVSLVDKWDQVYENLTLLSGSACDKYVKNLGQNVGSGWLCLNKSFTLQNNGYDNKTKLGLRIVYKGFFISVVTIQVKMAQYQIINNQLQKNLLYTKNIFSTSQVYPYTSQAVLYDDEQSDNEPTSYWTVNKYVQTGDAVFKGITFQLLEEFIRIKKTTPSIWDVINNAWGIVVLAFSLFLSKITRYMNVKQRQKITQSQQNQNRNDIVAIISTQYKLIYRVFYEELKQVKYFYKTNMNDLQLKDF